MARERWPNCCCSSALLDLLVRSQHVSPCRHHAGITSIDPYGRRLYAFLQKAGGNVTAPFDLVGMSLSTGEVMSHVLACKEGAYCPWSLEFMPSL